jgi:hypothetical protein
VPDGAGGVAGVVDRVDQRRAGDAGPHGRQVEL